MKVGNKVCVMRGHANVIIYATNMSPVTLPAGVSESQIEGAVAEYELKRQAIAKKDGEFLEGLQKPEQPGVYYCEKTGSCAKESRLIIVGKSEGGFLYVVDPEHADRSTKSINHPDFEGFKWFGPIDPGQVNPSR